MWKYKIIDKDRIYREPKMFFLKKVCKQMDRITTDFVSNKNRKTPVPESFFKLHCRKTLLKNTLAQMFSCEFWEIFKNNFFIEHLRTTASDAS